MIRKRICIVIPTHWSYILGGAEYQASLITQNLIDDGRFLITVLCRNVKPSYVPNNYTIKTIQKKSFLSRYSKLFDIKKIVSALKDIQPDVIYQRTGNAYTGACAWYARKRNIPMIWHISSEIDVSPYTEITLSFFKCILHIIEKKCLEYGIRNATYIIAQTDKQAELLKKHYVRTANQIIKNFHPFPETTAIKNGDRVKIIWIANFKPNKQPELFVRLAKELENVIDADFIMIGNRGNPNQYDELLKNINSINSLEYLGEQPQKQVNEILSKSHLLINTSKLEGFPNTFVQAWIYEVPVISLNVDPDNLIQNYNLGICAGNFEKLKEAVIELVRSPECLKIIGKNCKHYAYENHSMNNIDQIHKVFQMLK